MTYQEINKEIQKLQNHGDISDGYHTFSELYDMRIALFIALVRQNKSEAWKAKRNADGTKWEGWFVLGIFPTPGKQITFHLPNHYWDDVEGISEYDINPYFDGHNSTEIEKRLLNLNK